MAIMCNLLETNTYKPNLIETKPSSLVVSSYYYKEYYPLRPGRGVEDLKKGMQIGVEKTRRTHFFFIYP